MQNKNNEIETITLGGGCFWCVEAVFQKIRGVILVESGYTGGASKNPSYEEICSGTSGHVEVCQISFDTKLISLETLLLIFWQTHDPTTLNRQGNDVGTQYRSVIFYHNQEQKVLAEKLKAHLGYEQTFDKPIVTSIEAFEVFYKAEEYHQNYYRNHPNQSYCHYIISPKLKKLETILNQIDNIEK